MSKLEIWTVYENPRDWPEWYVARKFLNDEPTGDTKMARSLESLREMLPPGLTQLPRFDDDDPVIVEVWL